MADTDPTKVDSARNPSRRVGDAERERVVSDLTLHYAQGRLTLEELAERVEGALGAVDRAELDAVVHDLPPASAEKPERPEGARFFAAVFGRSEQRSRWRPAERIVALAVFGRCTLDLRMATITGPRIRVLAVAFFGRVELIVPVQTDVELSGFALFGAKRVEPAYRSLPPLPAVRARGFAVFGAVDVVRAPPEAWPVGRR